MARTGNGLGYTARLNVKEAIDNARLLKKELASIGINTASTDGFSSAQKAMKAAMLNSQVEAAKLREENIRLRNEYEKVRITAQEYRTEIAKINLARKQEVEAAKLAKKAQQDVAGSYNEAQKRLKELGIQIKSTAIGLKGMSPELRKQIKDYNDLNDKLKAFDATMGNHQRNVGNYQKAVDGLKGLAANYLSGFALIGTVKKVLDTNAQISDSLADVRRTAGLTAKEADNLATQLKKIDTRTSLQGLLEIATIGGQLGIAKDQLAGFTAAVNQLAVALGGELAGGAEGIAKSLGVLDNIFKVTQANGGNVEKSFNQIGSAILGLGQSGLATGDFLTDFGERVGGVAKQAGLSLPVILSYGAVLQENGVNAEVAGSSFKRLLSTLTTSREKFFAVAKLADANLTLKDFTNIINTDAKKALDLFFAGLAKGGTTTTAFNDILAKLNLSGVGVSQTVAALSQGQESLNGHIKQAGKDFNEATLAAEQYALKNDNLAASLEKTGKIFTDTTTRGGISSFFKAIIDGINATLSAVDRLSNSQSWKSFFLRVAGGLTGAGDVGATALDEIAKYKDMTPVQRAIDLFRDLTDEKKKQKLIDQTNIRDKAYEQATQYTASKQTIANYNQEQAILKALRAEYKGLGKDKKAAGIATDVTIGGDDDKKKLAAAKKLETDLNAQRALQAEIDALTKKGSDKRLSDDEEELTQIDAKYKKLREKANAFNNSIKYQGFKVNTSGLLQAQSTEYDAKVDEQAANKLKVTIDAQKKIYDEFEQYKLKLGADGAKKLYANEIDVAETYLQYLNQQRDKLLGVDDVGKGSSSAGGENITKQLELIDKQIEEEKALRAKADKEIYANALAAAQTYDDAIKAIDLQYNTFKKALGKDATTEQLSQLQLQRDAAIRNANEQNAYAKSGYEKLIGEYDTLTRGAIQKRLQTILAGYDAEYKAGKLTAQQLANLKSPVQQQVDVLSGNNSFNKIGSLIKAWKNDVQLFGKESERAQQSFKDLAAGISASAQDASSVLGSVAGALDSLGIGGEALQETFKNVQGVAEGIGGIAKGIATGNPVDVITGSLKLLTSVVDLFNVKDKKLEKQIQGYRDQLDALGKAYKQLDRDVANSVGESIYTDQAKQIENLKQQQIALTQARDAERSKKKADQSKIAEFQSQIDSIPQQIEDIQKAIGQNLIQTTFKDLSNALSDAFTEAFKAGEDAAGRFDQVFADVIANAIKNSLKLKILDPIVKKFTDDLTQYAQENNNSVIGFDFESYKKQLKDAGDLFTAGLEGSKQFFQGVATGTTTTTTAVTGTITSAGLTEDSANKAMGVWRGTYDQTKLVSANTLQIAKSMGDIYQTTIANFQELQAINANTLRTANNTDRLASVEKAVIQIAANTSSSSGYQNLLNGGVKP